MLPTSTIMLPEYQWWARVTFVDSESSQSHKPFVSEKSEFFSSPVRVESQELSNHFESLVFKIESLLSQMKFYIFAMSFSCYKLAPNMTTWYKMAPNKLQNGTQCCFSKLDCYACLLWSKYTQTIMKPLCATCDNAYRIMHYIPRNIS